jgi:DNA-binding NtrC family response regulator
MIDRSILIIERDGEAQRALAETLSGLGCSLALVSGPREAAEALAVQAPDLVILGMDPDPAVAAAQHEQIQELTDTGMAVACLVQRTNGPEAEQVRLSGAADLIDRGRIEDVLEVARRLLPPADDEAPSQRRRSTMRVLVIEDDAVQRRLIEACLRVAGRERVEVTFCGTAGEARQLILEGRFDCILLDHILPDGNGLEILEDVEEHLLTTPVIGLSGTASTDVALEYFRAGCCDFLCKDDVLMADQLRRRIADTMSRFQRRAMATIIERRELGRAIVQSATGRSSTTTCLATTAMPSSRAGPTPWRSRTWTGSSSSMTTMATRRGIRPSSRWPRHSRRPSARTTSWPGTGARSWSSCWRA